MIYGSVCSGIEAASVAWNPLGMEAAWLSEIEPFPSAVLAHRYPGIENRGDMTRFKEWPDGSIDVLVGGTPCQSFSVAGKRGGMDDPRGQLALAFAGIAQRFRPRWIVWENVPGVLSSGGGRDFGSFLWSLAELGYGWAYRVLDAQNFGVPQRRRRVFVVGHLGDWRRAAAVLFEPESVHRNSPKGRKAREDASSSIAPSVRASGPGFSRTGDTRGQDPVIPVLAGTLAANAGGLTRPAGNCNELDFCVPVPYDLFQITAPINRQNRGPGDPCHTLAKDNAAHAAIAFNARMDPVSGEIPGAIDTDPQTQCVARASHGVRRLTPRECERLQGFPDDYTLLPGKTSDGPRYKALGNSMAVPVMRWIGERIELVESLGREAKEGT